MKKKMVSLKPGKTRKTERMRKRSSFAKLHLLLRGEVKRVSGIRIVEKHFQQRGAKKSLPKTGGLRRGPGVLVE